MPKRNKTILVIANLDTRGEEFLLVKEMVEERGHLALILDFSMEQEPLVPGDISCEEVAKAGGMNIHEVRASYRKDRERATETMIKGAQDIVEDLLTKKEIDGVLGVGGATASLVATSVMKRLPFGFPKVMATPMAGHPRYVGQYVGTKDITMYNTVVDVMEMNPILQMQLINAVGAICGMVEMTKGWEIESDSPVVAITSFGFAERCVEASIKLLQERGYISVPCHAQGRGDRAMDEMIRQGLFQGVLDIVTRGVVEEMYKGNCAAGPDRILAASQMNIPQVLAPSGLDMISYGGRSDLQQRFTGRKTEVIDSLRVEVRTTAEELREVAKVVAERINQSKIPVKILIPLKGWSSLDQEGRGLYDPEADRAFVEELRRDVKDHVEIMELDMHLYTPEFGRAAAEAFDELYKKYGAKA